MEEEELPPAAQKAKGSAVKRKKKEARPKVKTGSAIKEVKKSDSINIA